ncbi:MAG TPA: radical SAM family heme chaperone HemW [Chryseosolibacter sp.]|nr:radical SAM family heme chaperone HemW [Chryseosolibacter sp.]
MAGVYVHIPFCKQACYYCDFHFSTNSSDQDKMTDAICRELGLRSDYLGGEALETIYLGGGTPSLLSSTNLERIMQSIRLHYPAKEVIEATCEANPDDLTKENLYVLKQLGFNRLSIGIQTFNDDILQFLNRAHSSKVAINSYMDAREAGFANISVDLIYALPGQSEADWIRNVNMCLDLHPEHISAYSLTIEEKTVFGKWVKAGRLKAPPDSVAAHHLEMLVEKLTNAGYEHYEVSNFAKPGYFSKHNSNYWRQQKYIGVGPSAHSYNGTSRQYNISNNALYIKALLENKIPAEKELLTRNDQVNEFIMTSLRTQWGCDHTQLKELYSYDILAENSDYISDLISNEMAFWQNGSLTLTRKGILLADKIASDLFLI